MFANLLLAAPSRMVVLPDGTTARMMAPAQLRVQIAGDPSATETVIFVHGWPDDHTVFEPMLSLPGDDALSQSRCVLVDLPRADGAGWVGEDLSFPRLASLTLLSFGNKFISSSQTPLISVRNIVRSQFIAFAIAPAAVSAFTL